MELREDGIYTHNVTPQLDTVGNLAEITASDKEIFYRYRGVSYQIEVEKARVLWDEDFCRIVPDAQDVAIRFGES